MRPRAEMETKTRGVGSELLCPSSGQPPGAGVGRDRELARSLRPSAGLESRRKAHLLWKQHGSPGSSLALGGVLWFPATPAEAVGAYCQRYCIMGY